MIPLHRTGRRALVALAASLVTVASGCAGEEPALRTPAPDSPVAAVPPEPTNVVLVIVDDLGFGAAERAPTPNLDAIAARGRVFANHRVDPAGTPTRYALLHGSYGARAGLGSDIDPDDPDARGLATDEVGLAEVLLAHGYDTAFFGTWDLSAAGDAHPFEAARVHGFSSWDAGHPTDQRLATELASGSWTRVTRGRAHAVERPVSESVIEAFLRWSSKPREARGFVVISLPELVLGQPSDADPTARYDAALVALDAALAPLVGLLERDDTNLILTSDRGAPEHLRSASGAHEPLLFATHGTLIAVGPGFEPGRSERLTHAVDVATTILGLTGAPSPGFGFEDGVDLCTTASGDARRSEPVLCLEFRPNHATRPKLRRACVVGPDGHALVRLGQRETFVLPGTSSAVDEVPAGHEDAFDALRRFAASIAP